ncbi:MAG: Methyltransferase type 11 [Acidobacteria bacterium]|nr:Methyltransferase type 11 [Acidobacteriota bacterium]
MTTPRPTVAVRLAYGRHVLRQAIGVLAARLTPAPPTAATETLRANGMFNAAMPPSLAHERSALERFDLYLNEVMNSPRLRGQIVFEYGILLRAIDRWRGLRVLDVGTGRSTFPGWMSREGAVVTTLDLPEPAERRLGGFQVRVNDVVGRRPGPTRPVAGSMRCLPFRDDRFDLVTSLSVVEHLDTDLPDVSFVPYDEQQRRLGHVLNEMIRVAAPGGRIYITSECCDFDRATTDAWKQAYYYRGGPPLSGAWPVRDVPRLFYEFFAARGCTLVGGVQFDAAHIAREDYWTWRGGYFGGFSVLAQKR